MIQSALMLVTFFGGTALAWVLIDRIFSRYSQPRSAKPTKPAG
jgi:hypothetical protein